MAQLKGANMQFKILSLLLTTLVFVTSCSKENVKSSSKSEEKQDEQSMTIKQGIG